MPAMQKRKEAKPQTAAMKAFVMHGIENVEIMEKPVPEDPGSAGAIIKITRALVCRSDTHTLVGAIGDCKNLTLRHEPGEVVYKLGRDVDGAREGRRVAVNAITPCYKGESLPGYTSQCIQMLGGWKFATTKDGVIPKYFYVTEAEAILARVPDSVCDEKGATGICGLGRTFAPCLQICGRPLRYHAGNRGN
jgi:threonine dehydrogenase-like Zn-dependent dehydrogenase